MTISASSQNCNALNLFKSSAYGRCLLTNRRYTETRGVDTSAFSSE